MGVDLAYDTHFRKYACEMEPEEERGTKVVTAKKDVFTGGN